MPYPKDLPREFIGLWRFQYEPREKIILLKLDKKTKKQYKKLSYIKKMQIIDDLQSQGRFD